MMKTGFKFAEPMLRTVDTTILKFDADASFVPINSSAFFTTEILDQWNTMLPGKKSPTHQDVILIS